MTDVAGKGFAQKQNHRHHHHDRHHDHQHHCAHRHARHAELRAASAREPRAEVYRSAFGVEDLLPEHWKRREVRERRKPDGAESQSLAMKRDTSFTNGKEHDTSLMALLGSMLLAVRTCPVRIRNLI